jgi:hypothetical protein
LTNVKTFIEATKRKRTDEARITMNVVTASISGENLKSKAIYFVKARSALDILNLELKKRKK